MLVVDDDEDFLEILADLVRESGRLVFTAHSADEALQLLDSATVSRPCLVLLDWVLDAGNGKDFLDELHTRREQDVLVAVMSGDPRVDPIREVPEAVGTLRKPFDLTELRALLDRYC